MRCGHMSVMWQRLPYKGIHSCDKCDHTAEISVITQQHLYKCQNVLYVYMTIFFYKDNINFVNLKSKTALEFQNLFKFFPILISYFTLAIYFPIQLNFNHRKIKILKVGIYAGGLLYICTYFMVKQYALVFNTRMHDLPHESFEFLTICARLRIFFRF